MIQGFQSGLFQFPSSPSSGLPTMDETVKTTQNSKKYDDLKLNFWFYHLIEYFDGLLYY